MACMSSPQAGGREREKESWVCLKGSPQLPHMQTSGITSLLQAQYSVLLRMAGSEIWLTDVCETCNISTVCRLEGPSWLFIINPFLHRLLVIINLPSNRETPRMP